MTRTHLLVVGIAAATLAISAPVSAQQLEGSGQTPTIFGAHRTDPGSFTIGVTTGYPETSFNLWFGLHEQFDIGLLMGITYDDGLGGLRQRVGMDVHVPLRWTFHEGNILAIGLRLSPYFMAGEGSPSFSGGADLALLFDIAIERVIKIIVGPEVRTGFTSTGQNPNRRNSYDGGFWANLGVETLIARKFHLGVIFHGGGHWRGDGRAGGGNEGLFRALINFGYKIK